MGETRVGKSAAAGGAYFGGGGWLNANSVWLTVNGSKLDILPSVCSTGLWTQLRKMKRGCSVCKNDNDDEEEEEEAEEARF
jgi:hypothetical protein